MYEWKGFVVELPSGLYLAKDPQTGATIEAGLGHALYFRNYNGLKTACSVLRLRRYVVYKLYECEILNKYRMTRYATEG